MTVQHFLLRGSRFFAIIAFAAHRSVWPRRVAVGVSIFETANFTGMLFWQSYQQSPYILGSWIVVAVWIALLTYVIGVEPNAIISPPGTSLLRGARWVCSLRTVETIFEAQVAETQFEYYEALRSGHKWKAEWVKLRGDWHFCSNAFAQIPLWLIRLLDLLVNRER
jgi:hypothetical protein